MSREYSGSEQVMFKDKFINWGGALPIAVVQQTIVGSIASTYHICGLLYCAVIVCSVVLCVYKFQLNLVFKATKVQQKIDVNALLAVKPSKEEVMIDDGSGKIEVFPPLLFLWLLLGCLFGCFVVSCWVMLNAFWLLITVG